MKNGKIPAEYFFNNRNIVDVLEVEKYFTNNISFFLAFFAYRLGLSANALSIAGALCAVLAFVVAGVLPADEPVFSVISIGMICQTAFLIDCADGQLARATGTASPYGMFIDHALDAVSCPLQLGGFFFYAYRHFMHAGDTVQADIFLLAGFILILSTMARFFAWQLFIHVLVDRYEKTKKADNYFTVFVKNLVDHQVSVVAMFVFVLSPVASLVLFILQSSLRFLAYVMYLRRARPDA
jgi:phosphatidylglycerophosphate synthase